jgi:branched-chain amino acid transport system substrate-binding protein
MHLQGLARLDAFVRHAADVERGFDRLKGKTIGLVHLGAPYGKEPIPLLVW